MSASNYFFIYTKRPNGGSIEVVVLGFTLPLSGWLADVYIGRYRVIRWSMWIMWVGSVLATASSVVAKLTENYYSSKIMENLSVPFLFVLAIGFGGYIGNIIQFGMDQLYDASTSEITAFICWFTWTNYSSYAIFQLFYMCLNEKYFTLGELHVCISITTVIVSTFILDTMLVKEPVTQNPFKLIYKVIRYAIETSTQDAEVPSPTVKMSFLLVLTSVRINMEDHSQQSRWKMLKHFYD